MNVERTRAFFLLRGEFYFLVEGQVNTPLAIRPFDT
jgi:hypothetical protein